MYILLLIYNCDACKSFKVGEDSANQMHSFQSVLVFQVVYIYVGICSHSTLCIASDEKAD